MDHAPSAFPRLEGCGPIEALVQILYSSISLNFRDWKVAAPLKQRFEVSESSHQREFPRLEGCGPIEAPS